MKTVTVNYLSFNELSEVQQKDVLKKYSTHFVECDWWNMTVESVNDILETLFNTKSCDIYFSTDRANFCSYQIDINIKDILKLINSNTIQENYPDLQEFLQDEINSIKESYFFNREKLFDIVYEYLENTNVHTTHDRNSIYVDCELYLYEPENRIKNISIHLSSFSKSIETFLEKLSEYFLGMFKNEYPYLMSDEYIKDTFISEDTHFDENDLSIF